MASSTDSEGFPTVCDAVFATVVADQRGALAVLYWARSDGFGTPLVLLDWLTPKLTPPPWPVIRIRLDLLGTRCRPRYGVAGIWAEGAALAQQCEARPILEHLTKPDYWSSLILVATHHLNAGSVRLTTMASARMRVAKFGALPVLSHAPRDEDGDPTIPAWLYGISLALDERAASPPEPDRVKIVA